MNEIPRELLKVARELVGGTIQPPPVMVDEIYRWAEAKLAASKAAHLKTEMMWNTAFGKKAEEQAQASRVKIEKLTSEGLSPDRMSLEIEYAEEREKRALLYREEYENNEKLLEEKMAIVNSFPRVKPNEWKRAKRKFKVKMAGWRYRSKVMQAEDKRRAYADKLFGIITVELVNGNLRTKSKGYWKSSSSSLKIKTGGDLRWIIEHELRHWAQSYMSVILGKPGVFGRPSEKIKTPEVDQWAKGDKARLLKQKGILPDEFHNLDDVEFYTDLADEIVKFDRKLKRTDALEQFGSESEFLRVFVSERETDKEGYYVSSYFKALKKNSPGKWKKAVKELAKAVL